ncbi:MAG: hypothetical protein J2P48_07610 [Alphaproteobacteria bacterium]|nr:hypothetical protein [Alphaproteobacteria bacterium]
MREHVTLIQKFDLEHKVYYEVAETKNTIRYRVGEALTERDVRGLKTARIAYTVKKGG